MAPGSFEVEAGGISKRTGSTGRQLSFPLLLKQSVTRSFQMQIGTNGYSINRGDSRAQFLDDVTIGPKIVIADQTRAFPALAISGALSIPTFVSDGHLRTVDALFTGYITKDLGPIHADLNVGMNFWAIDASARPQAFTALALSASLVPPFGIMAEGYVFSDARPVTSRDGGFLFALSHAPRKWLVFDVGADIGFYPTTRSYSTFVGMTIIPVILWRSAL